MKRSLVVLAVLLTAGAIAYIVQLRKLQKNHPVLQWDWNAIDTETLSFPPDFIWGTASAAHQVEGNNENSNFAWWEKQVDDEGNSRIVNGDNSKRACEHWERYPEDIRLMKELGTDAYRFSVAWSKIMPREGEFDTTALAHYEAVCDSLLAHGIRPVVTLHHFTHPIWFMEKGGFTKEENIPYFLEFAERVFETLNDRVSTWCTFNEPGVYVIAAYFNGNFPPGKSNPELAAAAYEHMIRAHVQLYDRLKATEAGQWAQIGIVKNFQQFDPMHPGDLRDWMLARMVDRSFNESFLNAFKTGRFRFSFPTLVSVNNEIEGAAGKLDFLGLNYYSHNALDFSLNLDQALELKLYPGEIPTDMDYTIYPEGLYRAIQRASTLEVPILITENGIADSLDNRRGRFIEQSLYAVRRAMDDGADIRGYFYWSLMDNFEWDLGYGMRFGLYEVDFDTQERRLRDGSRRYMQIIRASKAGTAARAGG